ncbi:DUF4011 domain-containing protein [Demequina sp. TTPB684]|uniref:DUF4011 domain-containing protein n=1 Tax=unclassified Demequina TaxID=2620311 RepID=UPI001CF3A5B8|nr:MULTISPECIES: DUF4011 domain-containing protein [unclassified Demequina]MCB2412006.1 DUF4011 domain-containing protein [Demequina sp. TTPB684]UPU88077.1 DUF4011 domain-containing protein [Demequina sp. TMPB413]
MITGRAAVKLSLECVVEGARTSIDRALGAQTKHGDWVAMLEMRDEVRTRRPQRHDASDPALILRVLTEEWRSFTPELSFEQRALATELRSAATRWSHGEAFGRADTHRIIDTAARLLDSLGTEAAVLAAAAARSLAPQVEGDPVDADAVDVALMTDESGAIEAVLTDAELERVLDDWRERTALGEMRVALPNLEVHLTFQTAVNFALSHNGVSPLVDVTVTNASGADVEVSTLEFVLAAGEGIDLGAPLVLGPLSVSAGSERHIPVPLLRWPFPSATLAAIDEALNATLRVTLTSADGRADAEGTIRLLAADEWWAGAIPESLAAFVMPRDPGVEGIVQAVSARLASTTRDGTLNGYEGGAERAIAITKGIWDELIALKLSRQRAAEGGSSVARRVRRPSVVLESGRATDLEAATIFASVAEACGLNPLIVSGRRRALAGVMITDSQLPLVAIEEGSTVQTFVDSTILWPVDTNEALAQSERSLDVAVKSARDWMRESSREIDFILDVRRAHRRVRPLPVIRRIDGEVVVEVERQAARAIEHHKNDASAYESRGVSYPPRVASWRNALLDLTFRNPLLNMRTHRAGLDLAIPPGYLGRFEDMLAKGASFTVGTADDVNALSRANGVESTQDLPADQLASIMEGEHLLYSQVTSSQYNGRVVGLARKAKTVLEETGANNLYIALGSLEWEDTGRKAKAPLFLIPATIKVRRGQLAKIQIEDGAVAVPNQCLLEKLRVSHQLVVPALASPLEDGHGIDVDDALAQLRYALLDAVLDFKVSETAHLAVFQFSTLQLWQDVSDNWQHFLGNPVVRHLVETPTDTFVDPVAEPTMDAQAEVTEALPVSADGSQIEAVRWAGVGRSFVLEGPPGTGKSQTITNIIANSLAKGRRVLFVAEKQAALDVVKRRLDAVGLGPYCLDLHGRNQSPTDVRAQLRAAMHAQVSGSASVAEALSAQQSSLVSTLDRYPKQLHEQGAAGLSAWEASQVALALEGLVRDAEVPDVSLAIARDGEAFAWTAEAARTLGEAVQDLGARVQRQAWNLAGTPLRDGADRVTLGATAEGVARAVAGLGDGPERRLVAQARSYDEFDVALAFAEHVAAGRGLDPDLAGPRVGAAWPQEAARLREQVEQVRTGASQLLSAARPELLHHPELEAWAVASHEADRKWLKGRRRKALIARMAGVLTEAGAASPASLTAVLDAAVTTRASAAKVRAEAQSQLGVELPPTWNILTPQGADEFWNHVEALYAAAGVSRMTDAARDAARDLLRGDALPLAQATTGDSFSFGGSLLGQVAGAGAGASAAEASGEVSPQASAGASAATALREAWKSLLEALGSRPSDVARWMGDDTVLGALERDLPEWRKDADGGALVRLSRWEAVQFEARRLEDVGAAEWVAEVRAGRIPGEDVESSFRLAAARAVLQERLEAAGMVGFDGRQRERQIERYVEGTAAVREALVTELPAGIVRARSFTSDRLMGRVGELDRELGRKRGGMSVRRMLTEYGSVIGEVTPCLLMSPHSVARFLPPGAIDIDVVLFDEASQIRVAEAVGAMGRGKSVVVVGDSRQMPPTEFGGSDMFGVEEDDEDDAFAPVDQESILTEAVESRLPRLWLSWHYRSRDESLIAFSNRYYYEGRLSTFPSPPGGRDDVGISWRHVNGQFERGKRRVNRAEADAVVAEVRAILAAKPAASIGVVTFNVEQRDLVLDLLEAARDERVDAALARPEDPLFVKNLENVQGDERDVVLFTLAFSPDPETGKLPLNFGPLNRAGGERRLNVAITRARERVVIFSSFTPEHIELDRTSSTGLEHLRDYLAVAAFGFDGALAMQTAERRDLHRARIVTRLEAEGLEVRAQVGLSDFSVDLAVRAPGRGWVAVLLDTPEWAGRKTVGDRESLPPAILCGSMGWDSVVRVWLPSWVYEPDAVVASVLAAARGERDEAGAREADEAPAEAEPVAADVAAHEEPANHGEAAQQDDAEDGAADAADFDAADPEHLATPELPADGRLEVWREVDMGGVNHITVHDLNRLRWPTCYGPVTAVADQIVAAEAPLSLDRLMKLIGLRAGLSRVVESRKAMIRPTIRSGLVHSTVLGEFAFPQGVQPHEYRSFRVAAPGERRELADIAPHEILNAMKDVAVTGHGAVAEEVLKETARLFGYTRLTAPVRELLAKVLDIAKTAGLVEEVDGRVFAVEGDG